MFDWIVEGGKSVISHQFSGNPKDRVLSYLYYEDYSINPVVFIAIPSPYNIPFGSSLIMPTTSHYMIRSRLSLASFHQSMTAET